MSIPSVVVVTATLSALVALTGCGHSKGSSSSPPVQTVTVPRETKEYQVPSSSMEPTLHCGGGPGCEAEIPDHVEAATPAVGIARGDIVVFQTPPAAKERCGAG